MHCLNVVTGYSGKIRSKLGLEALREFSSERIQEELSEQQFRAGRLEAIFIQGYERVSSSQLETGTKP